MKTSSTFASLSASTPATRLPAARAADREASTMARQLRDSPRLSLQRRAIDALFGGTAQRAGTMEDEPLQGRFATAQRAGGVEEEMPLQGRFDGPAAAPNRTGMPDALKGGIESLSGMDLSDVRVHRNSSQPAQLNALAYAQGNDVHLAPGQDQHLPHEAWHVVQQRQGRVAPTMQMQGVAVNDDAALEHEADVMGARALQTQR